MGTLLLCIIGIYGLVATISAIIAWKKITGKANIFELTPWLFIYGIFVWGDAPVIGAFWGILTVLVLAVNNIWFLLLTWAIFWIVRGLGETIYWFNQQFSTVNRNPPERLPGFKYFGNDSIWFVYQISWQCWTVLMIILAIYAAHNWLS